MQEKKSSSQFKNLTIYGIGQGFNLITPLLIAPYLAYICGEEGFGKIGAGFSFTLFLIVIIDFGCDIAGVKEVAVNRDNKTALRKILSTAFAAKLVLLVLVFAAVAAIYSFIPFFSREKTMYFLCMPALVGQALNPAWIFQGIENFKGITAFNIASRIIHVAGVFIFIQTPEDYIYANLWWGIGMIAAGGISFFYLKSKYGIGFSGTSVAEVKKYLKANYSIFSSQIFVSLQLNSPMMLVSYFAGDAMAGKYKIIEQIVVMFKTYIFLFFNFVYPKVCYLLEKNVKEGLRFWKLYNGANFIFITFCMAVLYFIAEPVVQYFNPESITESAGYLRFGLLLPVMLVVSIPLKQLVLGWNRQKYYVRLTTVMVVFNLLLLVALLPLYGIYGVLASLIITEAVTAVFYIAAVKGRLLGSN